MTMEQISSLRTAATASSYQLVNFDSAEIFYGINPDIALLSVSGLAPCANMTVTLEPRIYIDCPEYWGIEVVGRLPGDICLTAVEPFDLVIQLTGITGSKGIEVIGANQSKTYDVAGGCSNSSEQ